MKTAVLVPSHIYYSDQLARLDKCIESLCSQTVVPDIFVSISFANDTYKREFSTLFRKYYLTVKFKLSAEQKFQMEHLKVLSSLVGEYDMLMFCDDDDTYLPMRVEKFVEAFESVKEHCDKNAIHLGGVRETGDGNNNDFPEYWSYGIPPSHLNEFFNRIEGYEDLMCHKFADMYLRTYLRKMGGESMLFATFVPDIPGLYMYKYTIDNPNSICARHITQKQTVETANAIIINNLTLSLICDRIDLVKKTMVAASTSLTRLNDVVPDAKRIQELTAFLYK
jgi:hypothetical protein